MVTPAEGAVEGRVAPLDQGARVDVTGRADRLRDGGDVHTLGVQAPIAINKRIQREPLKIPFS